jgi:hypothetical protein
MPKLKDGSLRLGVQWGSHDRGTGQDVGIDEDWTNGRCYPIRPRDVR